MVMVRPQKPTHFLYPCARFGTFVLELPICRLQIINSTFEGFDQFVKRCVVDFRRPMLIQPMTGIAKSTLHALGEEHIVMAVMPAVAEVDLAPNDQARILKQVGHIGLQGTRITTGFTRHSFASAESQL